jgi:hypothetical protein
MKEARAIKYKTGKPAPNMNVIKMMFIKDEYL